MAGMSLTMTPKVFLTSKPTTLTVIDTPRLFDKMVTYSMKGRYTQTRGLVAVRATPEKLSESIEQSIKAAQETCADDPVAGECAAAWDEVEEMSAAASHARDKTKPEDPLETYCKDNPETDECRTYDN